MAIAATAAHSTPADGTFSTTGAAAWNASQPVSFTGLTAGRIIFALSSTEFTDSANFTIGTAAGQGLFVGAGTATTDVQALSLTQTWNNAGVTFTGAKYVITDTASGANSLAWQILGGAAGSTNLLSVGKVGRVVTGGALVVGTGGDYIAGGTGAGAQVSIYGSEADNAATQLIFGQSSVGAKPMLRWGGVSSSFAAIRGNGTVLEVYLADTSGVATIQSKYNSSDGTAGITFGAQAVTSITVKDGLIVAKSP